MSPVDLPGAAPSFPLTGIQSHWCLSFQRENAQRVPDGSPAFDVTSDDYAGEIRATLPAGLDPGSYRFVIRGLSDTDYRKITLAPDGRMRVTLYLFWNDGSSNAALAYAQNALGIGATSPPSSKLQSVMTAVLAVQKVERTAGTLTYDVTVTARERLFDLLATTTLGGDGIAGTAFGGILSTFFTRVSMTPGDYTYHAVDKEPEASGTLRAGANALVTLRGLEGRLEDACAGKHGRGMFLLRNGTLHVGPRPIPLAGDPVTIDEASGLVEIKHGGRVPIDPNAPAGGPAAATAASTPGSASTPAPAPAGASAAPAGGAPADTADSRSQYKLTCKGRPDVKPGDLVTFAPQPEDDATTPGGGLIGAIKSVAASFGAPVSTGTPVLMYVESVAHVLTRADGFSTTIAGTIVPGRDAQAWDLHSTTIPGAARPQAPAATATSEARLADAVRTQIRQSAGSAAGVEVGEIRAVSLSGDDAMTIGIWQGLAAAQNDAEAGAARRLDVERPSPAPHEGVPYLTPFAWGANCGLVLPQYPGSRIVLSDRVGNMNDPVALGSLWQSGHTPPNTKLGDWWLILPVGVDDPAAADDTWVPSDFQGKATNDLIDADGARFVEVSTIAIRTGDLDPAGARPDAIDSDVAVSISYMSGNSLSKIEIKTDGSIAMTSAAGISLEAQGDITLKGTNVNVQVSGTMDVSKA